ncbi:hypothetical protein BDZ45DRAFT_730000 [Acephala macrosclerotiorum]|nr:hypothetical protein BDZ45DRAFT_730000 [Acephala macrosclerotiorum]
MAEAIAAFSLAANVIQFIDFGSKIAANFYRYHKAGSRLRDEASELDIISRDLEQILNNLQVPALHPSINETGLGRLAQECQKCAQQLYKKLQPLLKARLQQLGKREAIKVAFKAVWKEDEIGSLQGQLDNFRSQLTLHLLASLREMSHQSIAQQKEILEKIKSISKDSQQSRREVTGSNRDADDFTSPVFDFLTSKVEPHSREENKSQLRTELIAAIHEEHVEGCEDDPGVKQQLPSVTAGRARRLQAQILESLSYAGMDNREERIAKAYGETFKWVFEDSSKDQRKWSNFKDWLISNSQLYWITGKPGSGKSTLMKYICHPEKEDEQAKAKVSSRCTKFLHEWAGNCQLIMGSFFFWNSGMPLQMQQEGLLRTLLVQIFRQLPHLIQISTPRRWEALCLINEDPLDWSDMEFQQMLRRAVKSLVDTERLCLFVDGLDEFDGDHGSLVGLFKELIQNPSVKLCVSSRPWVVFEDAFDHAPSLRLQDLIYPDIKLYVSSHTDKDPGFELLSKREPEYAGKLVENIIEKASGVFLWVRLAVSSILSGMGHGDRISDLQNRLNALPTELEALYDRILLSLDPFYLEHTAHLFEFVGQSTVPPSVQFLAFVDDEDYWRTAIERKVQPISPEEADVLQETMRRRINSRCKGFLEIDKRQKLFVAQECSEPVPGEVIEI